MAIRKEWKILVAALYRGLGDFHAIVPHFERDTEGKIAHRLDPLVLWNRMHAEMASRGQAEERDVHLRQITKLLVLGFLLGDPRSTEAELPGI